MPKLLQDWVTEQAEKRPTASAVVSNSERLTYAELDALSTQLARLLKQAGCQQGDRVASLMSKSPMAIVSLLGIYKADCIYVPLDPFSPVSRLTKILDSCENRWLLAAPPVTSVLEELFQEERWRQQLRVGWLDWRAAVSGVDDSPTPASHGGFDVEFTLDDVVGCSARPIAFQNEPHDPAHILFTSGSTGTPKGVVITHSGVIHFIEWATKYFGMDSSDRVSGHPPLHFDISFLDIFGTAAVGGELHLVSRDLNLLPNKLADFIRTSELTQWFSVPSILNYMAKFDVVRFNDFPELKRLLWAGEVLPTSALIYWMKRLPHVRFTNMYGPTETTIVSSYYTVPECPEDPQQAIPIGTACTGEELLVLNESLQPLPPGETGELYIAGVGVAPGYWRDPERTRAAFVPHPQRPSERIYKTGDVARIGDDGLVYFLGRSDSQIKSRGYRIELGEIEAALNAVAGVLECAVVAVNTDGFEGAVICGAYVPAACVDLTPTAIRRELSRLVPGYMLPTRWLAFDRFPKNASGKIDRRRLKDVFEERVDAHAAQTA
jgi:amino acid adenylation domain-containing protein